MAYGLIPMINGKQEEWADISVVILGVPFITVTSIEYSDSQDMKNVYGAGNRVVGRVYGQFNPMVKLKMLSKELSSIQKVAVGGVIQNIPEFNIIVTYIDPAFAPVVHKIRNCRFMSNGRTSSRGDGEIEVELEMICSHVEFEAA